MSFQNDLYAGILGVSLTLPDTFEVIKKDRRSLAAKDRDHEVVWHVRALPWPFDLRPSFDEELRADIEADARWLFESAFEPAEWPPGSGKKLSPRTKDPAWSPIVDFERVEVDDEPALRVVRRVAYQPGKELLCGSLIVPHEQGFMELTAFARASQTGFRESVSMLVERDGASDKGALPPQAQFDDPALDERFPDHPLSRVRRALRWLIEDAGLEVIEPLDEPSEDEEEDDEQAVEEACCAVSLPPRFLYVPHERLPMSPTLASFARAGLGDAPLRTIDVWRLPVTVPSHDRGGFLKEAAVELINGWANEGATDLEQETEIVPGGGPRVAVKTSVRFKVGGDLKASAICWRAEEDGVVFRVAANGGPNVPEQTLREHADEAMAWLRRLDQPKKPWWKIW